MYKIVKDEHGQPIPCSGTSTDKDGNTKEVGDCANVDHIPEVVTDLASDTGLLKKLVDREWIVRDICSVGDISPLSGMDTDASLGQFVNIACGSIGIEGDQDFSSFAPSDEAFVADPDEIPGWEALDIGRKDIFAVDRYAHLEDGAQ